MIAYELSTKSIASFRNPGTFAESSDAVGSGMYVRDRLISLDSLRKLTGVLALRLESPTAALLNVSQHYCFHAFGVDQA